MAKTVDFGEAQDEYLSLPNRVKFLREQVLGLERPQFLADMRRRNAQHAMSTETLRNVEKQGVGSSTTVTRIVHALGAMLADQGYDPVDRATMLSPFDGADGAPTPAKAAKPRK